MVPRGRNRQQEAQTPRNVPLSRPEQQLSEPDRSDSFQATQALPSSPPFGDQPDQGKVLGFELYRDPLNAKRSMPTSEETVQTVEFFNLVLGRQLSGNEKRDLAAFLKVL